METKNFDEEILVKVRKLFALGQSPNKNEAENAILKAQELMNRYNISMSAVDTGIFRVDVQDVSADKEMTGACNFGKWGLVLASIISKGFRCKCYSNSGSRKIVNFMGTKMDSIIAKAVFEETYPMCQKMALSFAVKNGGGYNTFVLGFIDGLNAKLQDNCKALMIVTPNAVLESYDKLNLKRGKPITMKYKPGDTAAYETGFSKGRNYATVNQNDEY